MEDPKTNHKCSICGAENALLYGEDEYLCEDCHEIVMLNLDEDVEYFEDLTAEPL